MWHGVLGILAAEVYTSWLSLHMHVCIIKTVRVVYV